MNNLYISIIVVVKGQSICLFLLPLLKSLLLSQSLAFLFVLSLLLNGLLFILNGLLLLRRLYRLLLLSTLTTVVGVLDVLVVRQLVVVALTWVLLHESLAVCD